GRLRTIRLVASGHATVDPGEKRRHLPRIQARIAQVAAVAARDDWRRHAMLNQLLADGAAPCARVTVVGQREREPTSGVTRLALALNDPNDLPVEADVGRDRVVGFYARRRDRHEQ